MNYKYFIWDVGGTLFDTIQTSALAFQKTLLEFNKKAETKQIYHLLKSGSTITAANFYFGDQIDQFLKRYHELERPMQESPKSFPDTKRTLQEVAKLGGKNYIISNRDLQVVDFLEEQDLIQYFSYVITSNDGFARKPDPESLFYLFEHFDVEPNLSIMIGDRLLDLEAAHNAGIKGVLYVNGDEEVDSSSADYVVHNLFEVVKL